MAIQLRLLQALSQVGTEKNHTVIVPVPTDLVSVVIDHIARKA